MTATRRPEESLEHKQTELRKSTGKHGGSVPNKMKFARYPALSALEARPAGLRPVPAWPLNHTRAAGRRAGAAHAPRCARSRPVRTASKGHVKARANFIFRITHPACYFRSSSKINTASLQSEPAHCPGPSRQCHDYLESSVRKRRVFDGVEIEARSWLASWPATITLPLRIRP